MICSDENGNSGSSFVVHAQTSLTRFWKFWLTAESCMPTPPSTFTAPRHMPVTAFASGDTFGRACVGHSEMPARTRSTASVVISLDWRAAAARASAFSSWRRTDDDHVPWATFFFCVFDVVSAAFSDVVVGGAGGLTAGVAVTAAF